VPVGFRRKGGGKKELLNAEENRVPSLLFLKKREPERRGKGIPSSGIERGVLLFLRKKKELDMRGRRVSYPQAMDNLSFSVSKSRRRGRAITFANKNPKGKPSRKKFLFFRGKSTRKEQASLLCQVADGGGEKGKFFCGRKRRGFPFWTWGIGGSCLRDVN